MENFECSICCEIFDKPVECLKCYNNFCKKHVEGFKNVCPLCKNKPFNYRENVWLSRTISNMDLSFKCTICGYEGDKNSFWSHLIESHKNEMINHFNEHNNKNKNKISIIEKNIKESIHLPTKNEFQIINNSNKAQDNINNKFEGKNNIYESFEQNNNIDFDEINRKQTMNMKIKHEKFPRRFSMPSNKNNPKIQNSNVDNESGPNEFSNKNNSNERNKIHYCNKNNEFIRCNCCSDHICKPGNCLCVNCMKYNIIKLNLKNGELINRAGKIAKFFKGKFYCDSEYESIFENVMGMKFINHSKCHFPADSCNDCKVLNKFKDLYYGNN